MAKTILFAEDEEILRELLSLKLKEEGYEVISVANGKEALERLKEGLDKNELPDLLLLDILMPEMDGFELMRKIQEDERLREIPIIIISNSGQPVELEEAKRLGAKDWLVKTEFTSQEVVEKVINQIGK